MNDQFNISWFDHGREPKCPPNPAFPHGIDLADPTGAKHACKVNLPYPAKRCGIIFIKCNLCGMTAGATTAGRPDDPRSVTLPCKILEAS